MRAKLRDDPNWIQSFVAPAFPHLVAQSNELLSVLAHRAGPATAGNSYTLLIDTVNPNDFPSCNSTLV